MFFIPIPIFIKPSAPKVKSGDKYTAEWWQHQIGHYFTKQRTAYYLNVLANQGWVKKVYRGEYEIVRFKPMGNIKDTEIVTEIVKRYLTRCGKCGLIDT